MFLYTIEGSTPSSSVSTTPEIIIVAAMVMVMKAVCSVIIGVW